MYMYMYIVSTFQSNIHCTFYITCITQFLICFEALVKLAQQWFVCAPHLEPINKELMLLVTI